MMIDAAEPHWLAAPPATAALFSQIAAATISPHLAAAIEISPIFHYAIAAISRRLLRQPFSFASQPVIAIAFI